MTVLAESYSHTCWEVESFTHKDLSVFIVAAITGHPLQFIDSFLKGFR